MKKTTVKKKKKTLPAIIKVGITLHTDNSVWCSFNWYRGRTNLDNIFNEQFDAKGEVSQAKLKLLKKTYEEIMNKKGTNINKINYNKIFVEVTGG